MKNAHVTAYMAAYVLMFVLCLRVVCVCVCERERERERERGIVRVCIPMQIQQMGQKTSSNQHLKVGRGSIRLDLCFDTQDCCLLTYKAYINWQG